jgi:hypothetical protein
MRPPGQASRPSVVIVIVVVITAAVIAVVATIIAVVATIIAVVATIIVVVAAVGVVVAAVGAWRRGTIGAIVRLAPRSLHPSRRLGHVVAVAVGSTLGGQPGLLLRRRSGTSLIHPRR